jgi:hypothetical protein
LIPDQTHPAFAPYEPWQAKLRGCGWPHPQDLNALLRPEARSHRGADIHFVDQAEIDDDDYEARIYSRGAVSTRRENLHDLCNALVWCRFPAIKASLNALHHSAEPAAPGTRGAQRDAVTLFDESGLIVTSPDPSVLQQLAQHEWVEAFSRIHDAVSDIQCLVFGHALLEKLSDPYRSMTGHAVLLYVPNSVPAIEDIDRLVAAALIEESWLKTTSSLSPLPLMGWPGFWDKSAQDQEFYANTRVFRPRREGKTIAPLFDIDPG